MAFIPFAIMLGPAVNEISVGLIGFLFLFEQVKTKDFAFIKEGWTRVLLGFWAVGIVMTTLSSPTSTSILKSIEWIRFILLAFAGAFWILPDEKWRKRIFLSFCAASLFIALNAIFQYIFRIDIFGHPALTGRLTAVFGKQTVGIMTAWFFVPALFGFLKPESLKKGIAFGAVCCLAILLSGERFALIIGMTGFVVYLLYASIKFNRKLSVILLLVALGVFGILATRPILYQRYVVQSLVLIEDFLGSHYGMIWGRALDVGKDHMLTGVGAKNYHGVCIDPKYGPERVGPRNLEMCGTHPHNLYLEWFIESGLLGLAACVVFVLTMLANVISRLRHPARDPLLIGLTILILMRFAPFLPMTSFYHAWAAVPFWLVIGWAMAYPKRERRA